MAFISLVALALSAVAPAADDAQLAADVRCFTVLSYAVSQAADDNKLAITSGVMYFSGKIDGRRPGYDIQAAMQAMAKDDTALAASFPTEIKRCAAELTVKGEALKRLGTALKALSPGK